MRATRRRSYAGRSFPQNVYVSSANPTLWQYKKNSDGSLTPLSPNSLGGMSAAFVPVITPDGRYVFVMDDSTTKIWCFVRATDGTLSPNATPSISLSGVVWGAAINKDGTILVASLNGLNELQSFRVNADGTLTSLFTTAGGAGGLASPKELCISPEGNIVYVANTTTASVSTFVLAPDGTLTALAANTTSASNCRSPIASPDGLHAYIANQNGNNIGQYSRNVDGSLTFIATVATSSSPRGLCISADGLHVYVSNTSAANIGHYRRNPSTGLLTLVATVPCVGGAISIGLDRAGSTLYAPLNGSTGVRMFSVAADGSLSEMAGLSPVTGPTGAFYVAVGPET